MSTNKKGHWRAKLAESRAALNEFVATLSQDDWQQIVFSEGNDWTVHSIMTHLDESEGGMSVQVHKTRRGKETVPEGFDLARWNAGLKERAGEPTTDELLAKMAQTRAKTLEVMESLDDDDWGKVGRHPSRGLITIEQYYETIHAHELGHIEDAKKALKR